MARKPQAPVYVPYNPNTNNPKLYGSRYDPEPMRDVSPPSAGQKCPYAPAKPYPGKR